MVPVDVYGCACFFMMAIPGMSLFMMALFPNKWSVFPKFFLLSKKLDLLIYCSANYFFWLIIAE